MVSDYTWRPVQPDDLVALAALDRAWLASDGPVSLPEPTYESLLDAPGVALLCAATDRAEAPLIAVGWVRSRETDARLGGKVHPAYRRQGLGTYLVRWGEAQARALGAPAEFLIVNEAINAGSAALYAQEGYTCKFTVAWMQRDLRAPVPSVAQSFVHVPWTAENAPRFYEMYTAAFQTGPGFVPPGAATWIADEVNDPNSRPDLSLLAFAGAEPVGFITAATLPIPYTDARPAWISQVGVRPDWRGRGVAAGLISSVMTAFQREGFSSVRLHVNVNNTGAIRLYEQLGFQVVNRRAGYTKLLNPN